VKPRDALVASVLEDERPWGGSADRVQWADASGFLADDTPPYAVSEQGSD